MTEKNYHANQWLVYGFLAKSRAARTMDLDDAAQEARIGLLRAIERHDAARGKLSTFAYLHMRGRLSHLVGKETRRVRTVPLDALAPSIIPDLRARNPLQAAHVADLAGRAGELLAQLPQRTRAVIRERFWHGRTLQETGDQLGLTKERIRQIERGVLTWLRRELGVRPSQADSV